MSEYKIPAEVLEQASLGLSDLADMIRKIAADAYRAGRPPTPTCSKWPGSSSPMPMEATGKTLTRSGELPLNAGVTATTSG